jgi:cell shape-determining protein MreD
MRNLIAFPLIGLTVILQSAVISRLTLLSGYADLLLIMLAAWALQPQVKTAWHWAFVACIMVGYLTRLPWLVVVMGYVVVVIISQMLQRRVWQAPLLAMFTVTFLGTLLMHLFSYIALLLAGVSLSAGDVLGFVTLPSLLLNLFFAIPVYAFMRDLARWVYPGEEVE